MKFRQFLLIILLGIGLMSGCNPNKGDHDNLADHSVVDYPLLTLNLILDKDVYHPSDSILARLVLKNIGEQDVIVNKRMINNQLQFPDPFRDVSFLIISPSDRSVQWNLRKEVGFPKNDDFVTLSAGKTVEATYELQYDYWITYEPGNYIVIAYYKNVSDPDDGRIAWKGELTSNLVTFKIEP